MRIFQSNGKIRSDEEPGYGELHAGELGFTLIELMVAATLALILMLTTTTILFQTFEFADQQRLRPVLNDKAREYFDLLGDGGTVTAGRLLGMRDQSDFLQTSAPSLRGTASHRLQLNNPDIPIPATLIGPETSPVTINCDAVEDPVQDCGASGTTQAVDGYMARDPRLYVHTQNGGVSGDSDRSVGDAERKSGPDDRTIEVEILLIQPYQANRTRFRTDQVRESYRTIFTLNRSP